MASENAPLGFRPPRQARSRVALQRILVSAEQELVATGFDDLNMAAVAERAGLSVGAIYRRFDGKEQLLTAVKDRLLTRVEDDITAALDSADGGLREVIDVFTRALADGFSAGAHVIPHVVGGARPIGSSERSRRALENIQRLFLDATTAHLDEVRRSDPATALAISVRTITAACIHRAVIGRNAPDGISWAQWCEQVVDMATLYLTTPDRDDRPA
ncbi:MAG: TetR/AcrR family transcriptional regulator [Streptosporangiales bacterium]